MNFQAVVPHVILGVCFLGSIGPANGQEALAKKAIVIPIVGEVSTELKNRVADRLREAARTGVEVVVFDFQISAKSGFGESLGLAREIGKVQGSIERKVAYIGKNLLGHGLLACLACDEIVIGDGVKIGDAFAESPEAVASKTELEGYRELAATGGQDAWLIMSMVQKEGRIFRVRTAVGGRRYVPEDRLVELEAGARLLEKKIFKENNVRKVFGAQEARDAGLAKYVAGSLREAASLYGVAESDIHPENLSDAERKPLLLRIDRHVDHVMLGYVKRQLRAAQDRGCDVLFVEVDAATGTAEACEAIAKEISEAPVVMRKIAYVPTKALGPPVLIVFGCNEIVLGPEARIGEYQASGADLDRQADSLAAIAERGRFSAAMVKRFVNPDLAVFRVRDRNQPNLTTLMTDRDLEKPPEQQRWEKAAPGPIRDRGAVLVLEAAEAKDLQVAAHLVKSRDELYRQYGVEGDVTALRPGWIDQWVETLTSDVGTVFLLACGLLCLYLELQFPGFMLPGIVSAICFVLFFWSQWLAESAGSLEIVMFLLGVCLLAVELFLVPGFGLIGVAGLGFILVSLVLACQTFALPSSEAETWAMMYGAGKVGLSLVAFMVIALAFARFMPRMKFFDRFRLAPVAFDEGSAEPLNDAETDRAALVGAIGTASSPLRPAGRARIGDEYLDVVTQGEFIDAGAELEVVEVHPRRIVVRSRAT